MGRPTFTINYVSDFIKSKECKLLSKKYKNVNSKLEIEYKCGHIGITTFSSFRYCKKFLCKKCLGLLKYTINEVKEELENRG